ncbi:MAG: tetratricopeptide repeat protein [Sporomusaceae bacterium]|nr:tetratricopeptide repeat protein [Sporomusaceae bacterium]
MKVRNWMSGLCCTLLLSNFGVVHAAENQNLAEKQMVYNQNKDNLLAAKEYAVALAQSGQFSASLDIFKQLYQQYPDNNEIIFDYTVVLNWAGNNRSAIELFEKLNAKVVPAYVKTSVAGAYYQTGNYPIAQKLFHEAAVAGDRKAQIWEAQSLINMGEAETGYKIYKVLLEKYPDDIEVYMSRASMLMLGKQYPAAIADFEKALSLTSNDEGGIDNRRKINYQMAISYIRAGEEARAIILLKPYIQDGTADVFMQSDYVVALRLTSDYKTAISEGERLWTDYGKVPNFGLQSLADSYLRVGQVKKAEKIYELILQRDPNSINVKLGLAYSYMLEGKSEKGLELYRQILKDNPERAVIVLDDAYDFVAKNRFAAGKSMYNLIVDQFPDVPIFRQEMASSFADNEMPRQAYEQFKFLAALPDGELFGKAGMVESSVVVGDYHSAENVIGDLREKYAKNAISQAAVSSYERRKRGGMNSTYIHYSDYKGVNSRNFVVSADQNIGGSYSVLASIGSNHLTDEDAAGESITLKSRSLGLQYLGMKYNGKIWLDSYQSNGTFTGYRVFNNYYFDDHSKINFNFEKAPVLDVQALNPANAQLLGRIAMTNYTIGLTREIGARDTYAVNFTRGFYSDNNQVTGYDINLDRILFFNNKKSLDAFAFVNRTSYKYQQINGLDTVYESPAVRDTFGVGLTERWMIPKGYWQATTTFAWGRDRPEPHDFEPRFRLEYGHDFSPHHKLVVGAEYGAKTNRLLNTSKLQFGSRQYDIQYLVTW